MQNLVVKVEMTPEQLRVFRQKWIDQTAQGLIGVTKTYDSLAEAKIGEGLMSISEARGAELGLHVAITGSMPGDADGGLVPMRPAIDHVKEHASQMKAADDKTRDESLGRALRFTSKFTPVV